jgi:nicotinate phosphoribosyltransferase
MTIFDGRRWGDTPYAFDIDGLRRGTYADKYFDNVRRILVAAARDGKTFADYGLKSQRDLPVDPLPLNPGELVVEAQIFNRRRPKALIAGVDAALWMLRHGTGYYDEVGDFVPTWDQLNVTAVHDGVFTEYDGDPLNVNTVLEVRGRYKDFCILETTMLGVLSRASRIATNVYRLMEAINGKRLLFFPARFDLPSAQAVDGYAYWLAVQRHNTDFGTEIPALVSTDAQGAWWGAIGGGTVPHAIIANFLADTTAAMTAFAEVMPPEVPRIVLADFNNDSVGAVLATMRVYWERFVIAINAGHVEAQARWTLSGVRLDTAAKLVDKSLQPDGRPGVNEDLVRLMRVEIDKAWEKWDVPPSLQTTAQDYCKNVGITVSGGFDYEKIKRFEDNDVPVSAYGVGSSLFSNESSLGTNTDFTMDVVRVMLDGAWVDIAKVGRRACDNDDLRPVDLSVFG